MGVPTDLPIRPGALKATNSIAWGKEGATAKWSHQEANCNSLLRLVLRLLRQTAEKIEAKMVLEFLCLVSPCVQIPFLLFFPKRSPPTNTSNLRTLCGRSVKLRFEEPLILIHSSSSSTPDAILKDFRSSSSTPWWCSSRTTDPSPATRSR